MFFLYEYHTAEEATKVNLGLCDSIFLHVYVFLEASSLLIIQFPFN